jgi:cobalt-zinc-cadmium efflux system membrane fusion protein
MTLPDAGSVVVALPGEALAMRRFELIYNEPKEFVRSIEGVPMRWSSLRPLRVAALCIASSVVGLQVMAAEPDAHQHGGPESHGKKKPESRPTDVVEADQAKELGLPVAKPDGGDLDVYASLFGKVSLHPERALHLHPRSPGVVREVLKSVGDRVRPGEVLARIENNVGVQSVDVISPIGGFVLDRKVAPGQSVDERAVTFTVGDTSVVLADLQVHARELEGLSKGQKVAVKLLNGQASQEASLAYIAPILDERTRSGKVLAELRNETGAWRPGQFIIGRVTVGRAHAAIRIPRAAVGQASDEARLFVKDGSAFRLKTVRLGQSDESFVEVLSGLTLQDEFVAKPVQEVRKALAGGDEHDDHE